MTLNTGSNPDPTEPQQDDRTPLLTLSTEDATPPEVKTEVEKAPEEEKTEWEKITQKQREAYKTLLTDVSVKKDLVQALDDWLAETIDLYLGEKKQNGKDYTHLACIVKRA